MAASRKKVVVRLLDQTVRAGYLPVAGLLDGADAVALLDLEARLSSVALKTIRWIAYVRDFNLNDAIDPERLTRKTFLARPRTEGLWLRLTLSGGELLEGLAPLDLSLADGLVQDHGVYLVPPDIRSNTQRLFVPRTSFVDLQVVAVITSPSRAVKKARPAGAAQDRLFS